MNTYAEKITNTILVVFIFMLSTTAYAVNANNLCAGTITMACPQYLNEPADGGSFVSKQLY